MVNDFGNFFGVSFQDSHYLLSGLVEDGGRLVIATSQNLLIVEAAYVQCHNTRDTSRMDSLQTNRKEPNEEHILDFSEMKHLHYAIAIAGNHGFDRPG